MVRFVFGFPGGLKLKGSKIEIQDLTLGLSGLRIVALRSSTPHET